MDVLMILLVFVLGFVLFGVLFYAAAKVMHRKKAREQRKNYVSRLTAGSLKYKSGNLYSFK